ncbi:MAG: hypothetical protein AAFR90_07695 [Pseudomonadota bacterium]
MRIYKYSARKWGRPVAERTLGQITELEQMALADPGFGRVDAEHHSPIYRYATIRNSQTIFFHRLGEDVVMITAGYSGRAWRQIMQRIEPQIKAFIDQIETG